MADAARTEAVIQGVTAPMVAVPGPGQALMARSAGFGGTMPGMTAKIALRGGNQDAFRRWIANRNDVITANGLDQLMAATHPRPLHPRPDVTNCSSFGA